MVRKAAAVFLLFIILILPRTVFAEGEFASSYDVLYDVDESGITTVTEKISLKNLTSEYYASEFKLTIGATDAYDIKASDSGGALNVKSGEKDNSKVFEVAFNAQVAGMGKVLPWMLSFKSKDFAEKSGRVWEIRVPRISSAANLESYNFVISVPQSFGELSSVSPNPKSQSTSGGKLYLTFDKDQLKEGGVSATFGTNQLFDFDLTYHLENRKLMPALTSIALPADTSYQDVIYQRIEPKPLNVTVDADGNYLAWYRLNRNEKTNIRVIGSAKLYALSKVKNPVLPGSLISKYTSADKYWEKDNPEIASKLQEILGENPPQDAESKARLIYRFTVEHLKYNQARLSESIQRLGAVTALNNPEEAVCMEFTDLFIALARAAGIPARELNGYAHTGNKNLRPLSLANNTLHSWPEYWDEARGWVMVDPTWENTTGGVDYFNKFDLNHFVFAVRGSSSVEPVAAGSYEYSAGADDVRVSLAEADFLGKPHMEGKILAADSIIAGFPVKFKFKASNSGNAVFASAPLPLLAEKITILNAGKRMSGLIPAYGEAEFSFDIRTKSLFDNYNDEISIVFDGRKYTKTIAVRPFILFRPVPLMLAVLAALMIALYLAVLTVHIRKGRIKKKSPKK